MNFNAKIMIGLKRDHRDPESETVKRSLQDLNFDVYDVRTRKVYEISLTAESKKEAETTVRAMCTRLLANPTKDEFEFEVEPIGNSSAAPTQKQQ